MLRDRGETTKRYSLTVGDNNNNNNIKINNINNNNTDNENKKLFYYITEFHSRDIRKKYIQYIYKKFISLHLFQKFIIV